MKRNGRDGEGGADRAKAGGQTALEKAGAEFGAVGASLLRHNKVVDAFDTYLNCGCHGLFLRCAVRQC
jgi:hypothetical protein